MIGVATRTWIESEVGSSIASAHPLEGATTATVWHIRFQDGRFLVAKVFDRKDFLDERPDRAAHEAAVLDLLEPTPVPVPRLIGVDGSGDDASHPAVLMEWIKGSPELPERWVDAVAQNLSDLHSVDPGPITWEYSRYNAAAEMFVPAWASDPGVWEDAFAIAAAPPATRIGFVHRDYHQGNLLWNDGELAGVLDWLSGCVGPLAIDLAHLRSNLVMDVSSDAADAVLAAYLRDAPDDAWHPAWDVVDAIDFLPFWGDPREVEEWSWDHRPVSETRARFEARLTDAVRRAS